MTSLREAAAWLLGSLLAIGGGLLSATGLGPLVDFIAATSGLWSTLFLFGGRFVLPELGHGDLGGQIVLAAGLAVVLVTAGKFLESAHDYLQNNRR